MKLHVFFALTAVSLTLVGCGEIVVPPIQGTNIDVETDTGVDGGVETQGETCTTAADCDDGDPCTEDQCSTDSVCVHFTAENTCSIDGTCYQDGHIPDINVCKVCDPTQNATGWSDVVCDDDNPCTDNSCDAASGCNFPNNDALPCDDGQACSSDDQCIQGTCQGTCTCSTDADCLESPVADCQRPSCVDQVCVGVADPATNGNGCDDGNGCTQDDACVAGACMGGPQVDCDDANPCTEDSCNVVAGCQNVPTDGSCDDGDPCTEADACLGGACMGTPASGICDDGNPCTDDACTAGDCSYTNNTAPCDDGNLCTDNDVCADGSCTSGPFIDCDDGNVCTADACNPSVGCEHAPTGGPCDDGNECTDSDTCQDGFCIGSGGLDCDDNDPCTEDTCSLDGGCANTPLTGPCDDGDACTQGETCATGTCTGGSPLVCDDNNPCTNDTCDSASGCVNTNNVAACDDGNPCTSGDACSGGTCQGGGATDCDDGDICTNDSCDPATGCVHFDNAASCDDGNACTDNDACVAGSCVGGTTVNCNDNNLCTNDSCSPSSGCVNAPNTLPCDDGNGCTTSDQCSGGSCQGSGGPDCNDGNPCTNDGCDPGTGCTNTNNTAPCDDGDACTTGDTCSGGSCQSGSGVTCDDGNPCTNDSCNPTSGCQFTNNSAACDDGSECTTADQCSGGTCVGGPAPNCNDGNVCTTDSCNPSSGCVNTNNNANCNDNNACTTSDQCSGGVCSGNSISCNDGNPCTNDSCNSSSGCTFTNNTANCNDGDSCTTGDKCSGGFCSGNAMNCDDANDCTTDSCSGGSCSNVYKGVGAACGTGGTCLGGGCVCFTADTPILTAEGTMPIAEVKAGDLVISTDQHTGLTSLQPVREVEKKFAHALTTLSLSDGSTLKATPNHYLWVDGVAWVKAGELKPGDRLRVEGGEPAQVMASRTDALDSPVPVFNLIVAETKTYHVGGPGVMAHTCDFTLNVDDQALRNEVLSDVPDNSSTGAMMVVFNAQAAELVLADSGSGKTTPLPCVPLAKWSKKVAVKDDHLLALDTERRRLALVPLQQLRDVYRGTLGCEDGGNRAIEVELPSLYRPYDAIMAGDRVFVSYFPKGSNQVDMFQWVSSDAGPRLEHARSWNLAPKGTPLGLSGMAFDGQFLYVAGAAYICNAPGCTDRFEAPHLFAIDVDHPTDRFSDLGPANMNAIGVYRHPSNGAMFAILSGDHVNGYSSLQRIGDGGVLGGEIMVGKDAGLGEKAVALGTRHGALLPMSGDHIFVLDAVAGTVSARFEFDRQGLKQAPSTTALLDTRREADLQDIVPNPWVAGGKQFVVIDAKSEQLLHVAFDLDAATPTAKVLDIVPLAKSSKGVGTPTWGVWLD